MTLILWDVDHTLIENGGVSKENYALTYELLTGRPPVEQPRTDGRTDIAIMAALLEANGLEETDFSWDQQRLALIDAARQNQSRLIERGHALPGAKACLSRLADEKNIIQSVLTGNVPENAKVKLAAFDLDRWLDFEVGGFGSDNRVRGLLVAAAQARAAGKFGFDPLWDVTVLIGDTNLDVQAGLVGGARVIGVSTGISSEDELRAAGADAVLPDLRDVDAFMAAVDEVRRLGPTGPRADQATGG